MVVYCRILCTIRQQIAKKCQYIEISDVNHANYNESII
jgi:hypothetical protein